MIKSQNTQTPLDRITLGTAEKHLNEFDLIEVQKNSWSQFLEHDLKQIIQEFFPIDDYTGKKFTLRFDDIFFGKPAYTQELCFKKKLTYDQPVYIKLTLLNKKTNAEKSQDVYFFNLPIMTDRGTFIINGIERAIISQIVRSPGIYFTAEIDKTSGSTMYNAEVRPFIGAWLDFTINKQGLIEVKVNKKRKMLASVFLKLFDGENNNKLLTYFNDVDKDTVEKFIAPTFKKDRTKNRDEAVLEFYRKVKPGEPLILENAYKTLDALFFNKQRYSLADVGRYKINKKLGLNIEIKKENHLLLKDDMIATVKYLVELTKNKGNFDDIDHLGNRRLRTSGELVGMYGIRAGMIRAEKEVKERMETDLFGEQTVLCGGVSALMRMGFEVLVEAGYSPEMAYFECVHEMKLIIDLVNEAGISGMRFSISETAKWGDVSVGPKIIDGSVKKRMKKALKDIQSGKFVKRWAAEYAAGKPNYRRLLKADEGHLLEQTGTRLRSMMPWMQKRDIQGAQAKY
jgi:DNA-directed RNA polymerase subunit beta